MLKPTEMEVKTVIKMILSDSKSYKTTLNYAVGYCKVGIGMTGRELEVQCLYILNNISHWRHEKAKEVRAVLKAFAGVK